MKSQTLLTAFLLLLAQFATAGNEYVTDIAADDQTVWVGTQSHILFQIDKSNGKVKAIELPAVTSEMKTDYSISKLCVAPSGLFIGLNKYGVLNQVGNEFLFTQTPPKGQSISAATVDAHGKVWFAGLSVLRQDIVGVEPAQIPPFDPIVNIKFRSMVFDDKGKLWLGSEGSIYGFWKYTEENGPQDIPCEGYSHFYIKSLAVDQAGNVWIGAARHGLVKYDGTDFTKYAPCGITIPTDYAHGPDNLHFDKEGHLLFSMDSKLIYTSDGGETFVVKQELPSAITAICVDDDDIYIGTQKNGLFLLRDGELLPVDLTGTVGIEKKITPRTNPAKRYSLTGAAAFSKGMVVTEGKKTVK